MIISTLSQLSIKNSCVIFGFIEHFLVNLRNENGLDRILNGRNEKNSIYLYGKERTKEFHSNIFGIRNDQNSEHSIIFMQDWKNKELLLSRV